MADEKKDDKAEAKPRAKKVEDAPAAPDTEQPASADASDDSHGGLTDDQKAVDVADQVRHGAPAQHSMEDDTPAQWSWEDEDSDQK